MKFSGKFASAAIFAAFGVAAMAAADIGPFSSIGHITRTSSSLTNSLIGGVAPKVTLKILEPGTKSISVDGIHRTPYGSIDAVVTSDKPVNGKVTFLFGGKTVAHDDSLSTSSRRRIDFLSDDENRTARELIAQVVLKDGNVISTNKLNLEIDTEGPQLLSAKVVGDPTAASVALRLQFKSDDLKEPIAATSFTVQRKTSTAWDTIAFSKNSSNALLVPVKAGSSVTLAIVGPLVVGEYRVTVDNTLEDLVGNPAGQINLTKGIQPHEVTFSTGIFRPSGPAVDFPQYTQREKLDPDTNFNPGDHVESRVVRLYYNRDAHRVAQIINRDIQQWNRAGVNDARAFATGARSEADKARRDRENEEADAIATSEQMKTLERQLTVAQRAADRAQQRFDQIKEAKRQITRLKDEDATTNAPEIKRLQDELERETGSRDPETGDGSAQGNLVATALEKVTGLESEINQQRQLINAAKKRVANAEYDEKIANRTQFEAEVASGTADPDSYAPADLNSIDPVMQVSISVIGEGLIQLRGPIRGINEIRTMINQIDSPLGQVKVGLFTVQINGEEGDKMDEVAARLEGYIDLSRFLTNQSLQLLRRAVQETAGQISGQFGDQYPMHRQIDRDRKYVYAFFGRDFVDELYAMDSEFLHTENKLLSIHAMDTVSLPQATFLMALAKNSVREQILDRFMTLVQTELPVAEYSQRRTAGMLKKSRDISAFRRLISIPGFPKNPERALASYQQREQQKYCKKAAEIYRFHNLMNFFRADVYNDDVMTPVQREFIRLAQIFKSQMIAEVELKQRVVERALIQDAAGDEGQLRQDARVQHETSLRVLTQARRKRALETANVRNAIYGKLLGKLRDLEASNLEMKKGVAELGATELVEFLSRGKVYVKNFLEKNGDTSFNVHTGNGELLTLVFGSVKGSTPEEEDSDDRRLCQDHRVSNTDTSVMHNYGIILKRVLINGVEEAKDSDGAELKSFLRALSRLAAGKYEMFQGYILSKENEETVEEEKCYIQRLEKDLIERTGNAATRKERVDTITKACRSAADLDNVTKAVLGRADTVRSRIDILLSLLGEDFEGDAANENLDKVRSTFKQIERMVLTQLKGSLKGEVENLFREVEASLLELRASISQAQIARVDEQSSRVDLDHKKLLDYLIDEKEEKFIELVEGTRSHIAQMDNYLKRLAIALEDDFKVQFYDPAFEGVRAEGRDESVNFGQIERTTILTNNRTFAKVSPQASMEFDLPKRAPVVVEAMSGAKALMQDYGALVNDPTFVGLTGALSGSPAVGGAGNGSAPQVKPLFPTQGTDSQNSFLSGGPPGTPGGRQKTSLEQLIPDPAVYKIQTGTGFEIRPVIQPDGHSIMYDFNYLYTTNVREPVDPDEKHLGRIKQHYIHTQVQTSSFELREISRYQVALKVSRTSRGVPLLEDIPIAGGLFKPAPSAESSLQQNIILGQTTVYPTLFDLMGLRWSRHVADLDHMKLRELEHVVRGRNRSINDYVFDKASEKVDGFLNIEKSNDHYREDFYHRPSLPTPYHPNGYVYEKDGHTITDPTGRDFYRRDPRPEEYRIPQYDTLRRGPAQHYRDGTEQIDDSSPIYMQEPANDDQSTFSRSEFEPVQQADRDLPLFPPTVSAKSSIQRMSYERTAPVRR